MTIWQKNKLPSSCQSHEKANRISKLVKVIIPTEWQDCLIKFETKQTERFTELHRKKMFDTIKELYVSSVMQIIFHQPTTMTAGIFNKHFYRHFYGSEVWSTIWKEIHLQIIHFSSLFTSLLCFKGCML